MLLADGDSGGDGAPPQPGTRPALSHTSTHRALRYALLLHYGRHFGPHLLTVLVILSFSLVTGWWEACVLVMVPLVYFLPRAWWFCCRHASSDRRRARLILEHYAWRTCLMERPEPDTARDRRATRSGNWEGTFVRLVDRSEPGSGRLHGVPGPGWRRPVRGLRDTRVITAAMGAGGGTEVWFAGDPRFGGVVSPSGGGSPVLLRARGRRGLRGEDKAAPPERDAVAIRAGLLEYRDLPKRHPIRRRQEDEEAVTVMHRSRPRRRPGPSPSGVADLLERRASARILARTFLGMLGVLLVLCGGVALLAAVLPDGSGGVAYRLLLVTLALAVLAPAWPCLSGARWAGSGRERTGTARTAAMLTLWAASSTLMLTSVVAVVELSLE
ncbi:hypothetical protein [Streptomyces sporangiiformans]|uniref:Uncharacterized protein n=1 Tax=Streptomyces sporangiiformans TaxID=2315329 RepID=A0A505D5U7_9ACTN|nr:hypothetical protein [Streptomyces sporangiiformans]TPQ16128.1 hypothetical protein FGD71_043335 [Streptomyces sporangiiformans]